MKDLASTKISRITWLLLSCLALIWLIYPYIQTEILTVFYARELSLEQICQNTNSTLRDLKLVEYEKSRRRIKVYCLYWDKSENASLELIFTNRWELVLKTKLSKPNSFFWPIYS